VGDGEDIGEIKTTYMSCDKTLEYLKIFKKFPNYQFERRIDAFLYPYIEKGFRKIIGEHSYKFVYPELPLHKFKKPDGSVDRSSEYADFVLWCEESNTIYLVEFKTDISSIDFDQFSTYVKNCEKGWNSLWNYMFDKVVHTDKETNSNWKKFCEAMHHIHSIDKKITGLAEEVNFRKFNESKRGVGVKNFLLEHKSKIAFEKGFITNFFYLAPTSSKAELDRLCSKIPNASTYYKGIVTLSEFAEECDEPLKSFLKEIDY
jgi:hypothetical protein